MNKTKTQGFTLMEILVAITIVGIVAGIGLASYTSALKKSRDSQRKSDLAQLQRAMEAYQADFGVYPRSCNGMIGGCGAGNEACDWGQAFSTNNGKVYMGQLPEEKRRDWIYVYRASSNRDAYQIYTRLENEKDLDYQLYSIDCSGSGDECTFGVPSSNTDMSSPLSTQAC